MAMHHCDPPDPRQFRLGTRYRCSVCGRRVLRKLEAKFMPQIHAVWVPMSVLGRMRHALTSQLRVPWWGFGVLLFCGVFTISTISTLILFWV